MKLKHAFVRNFGSYKELDIDYSVAGLTLVYGPTGAGKSTLLDIPCWILFGITAKGGSVDEVRSWQNPDESANGVLNVETGSGVITVSRTRGAASKNDLYWIEQNDKTKQIRGKDITDTQRMLEERLGGTAHLYLTAAYACEFSPTGSFFIAKAKDRRALFDRIAVLDFPIKLKDATANARKDLSTQLQTISTQIEKFSFSLEQADKQEKALIFDSSVWFQTQAGKIKELTAQYENFEQIKAQKLEAAQMKVDAYEAKRQKKLNSLKIDSSSLWDKVNSAKNIDAVYERAEALTVQINEAVKCPTCGAAMQLEELYHEKTKLERLIIRHEEMLHKINEIGDLISQTKEDINPFLSELEVGNTINHYAERISEAKEALNPYEIQAAKVAMNISILQEKITNLDEEHGVLEHKKVSTDHLNILAADLRAELLKTSVKEIEDATNKHLDAYFDSEIRVSFNVIENDNLEVGIQKNGYDCVYTQLSKGQRGLLKLAFSVAVMSASANRAGIHIDTLFFDEALDGLDSDLKLKAYSLFESLALEHQSIFLIDHAPEFQNLFSNKYRVTLDGDYSQLEQDHE